MSADAMPRCAHGQGFACCDELGGSLFPQVLPHAIPEEGAVRSRGPEPPDLSILRELAASRAPTEGR